ncbi:MAG: hypothetical protein WCD44_03025 [Candidatus Babeliales bacterium]
MKLIIFCLLLISQFIDAGNDQDSRESVTSAAVTAGTLAILTTKAGAIKALVIGSGVVPYAATAGSIVALYLVAQGWGWLHEKYILRRTNEKVNEIGKGVIKLTQNVRKVREGIARVDDTTNNFRKEVIERFDTVDINTKNIQVSQDSSLKELCATRQQITSVDGKLETQFKEITQIKEKIARIEANSQKTLKQLNNLGKQQSESNKNIQNLHNTVNEIQKILKELKEQSKFQEELLQQNINRVEQSQNETRKLQMDLRKKVVKLDGKVDGINENINSLHKKFDDFITSNCNVLIVPRSFNSSLDRHSSKHYQVET